MKSKHVWLPVFVLVVVAYCPTLAAQGPVPLRTPPSVTEDEAEQEPAEEPTEPTADTELDEQSAAQRTNPFVAAGWCTVKESGEDSTATDTDTDPSDDTDDQTVTDSDSDSYCDIGIGFALYTRGQLSVVGVIGSMSAGLGLGWRIPTPERGPVLAVAIGALVRYDADGIGRDIRPGLGITLTFGRTGTGGN